MAIDELDGMRLWAAFQEKADDDQRLLVRSALQAATDVLDRVIETFPTYTLHNRVHARNVVTLMGELLGAEITRLTALESAILLLSAYYHDIGMVFDDQELQKLAGLENFQLFLGEHPDAFIAVERANGEVTRDIAEWYCRWHHPDRVYTFLDRLPQIGVELDWGAVSLREALGELCRSHGRSAAHLRDPFFEGDFAAQCDLRFCAVVLRVADILDFDRSRSPKAVYQYLGLDRRDSPRKELSDVEWRKHLASDGFSFPLDRDAPYELDFVAGPSSPAVEHDVRAFLDVIEDELRESSTLLLSCSPRWRDFVLPNRISRRNIRSKGYKYGEHRFTLERGQVLKLFMGDRLYESRYAFVREMLQNAIDASRHREFFEHSHGNASFCADPIQVEQWTDREGYRWVSFEDHGMGMTEEILTEYFLKVGTSYYQSSAFRAEVLGYGEREFLPISRFGIGVLSCFVVADRVEVSTRRAGPPGACSPIRVSLADIEGFYTLQAQPMLAAPMPAPSGDSEGYRETAGTTIAVRLDPRLESDQLDVRDELGRVVFVPPVPVRFEGESISGGAVELVDRPWTEPRTFDLDPEVVGRVEEILEAELPDGLRLHVLPVDITRHSSDPNLRGQAVVAYLSGGPSLTQAMAEPEYGFELGTHDELKVFVLNQERHSLGVVLRHEGLFLHCRRSVHHDGVSDTLAELDDLDPQRLAHIEAAGDGPRLEETRRRLQLLLDKKDDGFVTLVCPEPAMVPPGMHMPDASDLQYASSIPSPAKVLAWSHNGVSVPRKLSSRDGYSRDTGLTTVTTSDRSSGEVVACLKFSDRLRPEVSVSRDELLRLPWTLQSAANLAFRRAFARVADLHPTYWSAGLLDTGASEGRAVLSDFDGDPLLHDMDGWPSEEILSTGEGPISIARVLELAASGQPVVLAPPRLYGSFGYGGDFLGACRSVLIQLYTSPVVVDDDGPSGWRLLVTSDEAPSPSSGLRRFVPLQFARYQDSSLLKRGHRPVNMGHPFAAWLIDMADRLAESYPSTLAVLRDTLSSAYFGSTKSEAVEAKVSAISTAVERLHALDRGLAPPASVVPSAQDFD